MPVHRREDGYGPSSRALRTARPGRLRRGHGTALLTDTQPGGRPARPSHCKASAKQSRTAAAYPHHSTGLNLLGGASPAAGSPTRQQGRCPPLQDPAASGTLQACSQRASGAASTRSQPNFARTRTSPGSRCCNDQLNPPCLRELCVHILLAKAPDQPSGWASKCICAGQRGGPSGDRTPNPRIKRTCVPRPVLSG